MCVPVRVEYWSTRKCWSARPATKASPSKWSCAVAFYQSTLPINEEIITNLAVERAVYYLKQLTYSKQ